MVQEGLVETRPRSWVLMVLSWHWVEAVLVLEVLIISVGPCHLMVFFLKV